jgi:ethanolamine-phosphate cytidylyltransferase
MTHVTFQLSGQALQTVKDLENKLLSLEQQDVGSKDRNGKEIRIWMDGAFDMMHYGE